MAKNYVSPGHVVTVPATAAVASGDVVVVGSIVGIAAGDAAIGVDLDICVGGIYELPKVSAQAISLGDPVYFDGGSGLVTATASGNTKLGVAVAAAADPSATLKVRLSGF